MPTEAQLKAVEGLKTHGNTLFAKGKYGAAVEKYTEAITLVPTLPVLFVNRAMAYRKKEQWSDVLKDASTALQLDKDNMKANYLAGLAYLHDKDYEPAIRHLNKALEIAREANDSIKDDIWRELARAKFNQWERDSAARKAKLQQLKSLRETVMATANGAAGEVENSWNWLFDTVAKMDTPAEVPSVFTCPLTMETFRDPSITKYGQSYERAVLLEHLKKNKWDPITRGAMTELDIVPNVALRQAVQLYLDEHPWAWRECMASDHH